MKDFLECAKIAVQIALVAFVFYSVWRGDADRSKLVRDYGAAMRFVAANDPAFDFVGAEPVPVAAEVKPQVEE